MNLIQPLQAHDLDRYMKNEAELFMFEGDDPSIEGTVVKGTK